MENRIAPKSLWAAFLVCAAVVVMVACENPTAGPSRTLRPGAPSLVLGGTTNNTAVAGLVKICKLGNASGTFTVARSTFGTSTGSAVNPTTVAPADPCRIAVTDSSPSGSGSTVIVTEQALPANTVGVFNSCVGACSNTAGASITVNLIHGAVVTYTNTFTPPPPPPSCVFTKGYYRNHPSAVIAVDGRTLSQTQQILEATPGKPGNVTFGDNNLLLNFYQQLLTALINLNGNPLGGPPALDVAIAAAQAGTDGSGLNITTNLTDQQLSDLLTVIDNFNEGLVANFPHCDD